MKNIIVKLNKVARNNNGVLNSPEILKGMVNKIENNIFSYVGSDKAPHFIDYHFDSVGIVKIVRISKKKGIVKVLFERVNNVSESILIDIVENSPNKISNLRRNLRRRINGVVKCNSKKVLEKIKKDIAIHEAELKLSRAFIKRLLKDEPKVLEPEQEALPVLEPIIIRRKKPIKHIVNNGVIIKNNPRVRAESKVFYM